MLLKQDAQLQLKGIAVHNAFFIIDNKILSLLPYL